MIVHPNESVHLVAHARQNFGTRCVLSIWFPSRRKLFNNASTALDTWGASNHRHQKGLA